MFDSYVVKAGDQHHSHRHEVHEHRAPTDESVKLLREMEEKALANVLSSVRLEGCEVDCIVHYMAAPFGLRHRFAIQYRLGKTTHTVKHDVDAWASQDGPEQRERIARELLKALSEDIAMRMLAPKLGPLMPQLLRL